MFMYSVEVDLCVCPDTMGEHTGSSLQNKEKEMG